MIDIVSPQDGPRSCRQFIEQYQDDLSKCISKAHHMSYEMLRMNTFKHKPHDSYKGVWPSQLARAGLYYDPRSEATICFACGFRKPASFWVEGRNPFHVHRIISPNCRYITGHFKENVPFHTQDQRKDKLSYLEPNSSVNRPAPSQGTGYPGRLTADGIPAAGPPSNQVTAPTFTQETNSFSIEPRPRNRLTQPQNQRSASEIVQSLPIGSTRSNTGVNNTTSAPASLPYVQSFKDRPYDSLKRHRIESPNCKFITDKENKPLRTRRQRKKKRPASNQTDQSSSEATLVRVGWQSKVRFSCFSIQPCIKYIKIFSLYFCMKAK